MQLLERYASFAELRAGEAGRAWLRERVIPIDEMERSDALLMLRLELELDGVWTLQQVRRLYGRVTRSQLAEAGLVLHERLVCETQGSVRRRSVTFVSLESRFVSAGQSAVQHAVGVAGARHVLGVPLECWVTGGQKARGVPEPDAVMVRGEDLVAVEYDFGGYTRAQLGDKARVFAEQFDGQVWACPSARRGESLRKIIYREALVWLDEPLVVEPYRDA